jgi:hypothetical protein
VKSTNEFKRQRLKPESLDLLVTKNKEEDKSSATSPDSLKLRR